MPAYGLSPDVSIIENDETGFVQTLVNNAGATVGLYTWGPVDEPVLITGGAEHLTKVFGTPTDTNIREYYFSAANFLKYGSPLYNVRAAGANALNASDEGVTGILVKNSDHFDTISDFAAHQFIAKCPGVKGNSITVDICIAADFDTWAYKDLFEYAPDASNNEVCVVIVDENGEFGEAGTVLEKFELLVPANGAVKSDGTNADFREVINTQSKYLWCAVSNTDVASLLVSNYSATLSNGVDDNDDAAPVGAWTLFEDSAMYPVNFMFAGAGEGAVPAVVVDTAAARGDCFAFVSPQKSNVVNNTGNEVTDILDYRATTLNKNTSFAVMDCNWKYIYDRFNNTNLWIPCNSDTAGLLARVYNTRKPWESPAGYENGQLMDVIKLAWNPKKADRDVLYPKQINPIVSERGEGTMLFGDKTMLTRPSAFGYINVRSVFNVVEKSIAKAAKYQLFKLNNPATQTRFFNMINPFLRNIQADDGIKKYMVIVDSRVNTDQVVQEGRFVGKIAIQPYRSIQNIVLEFTAVGTDVQFKYYQEKAAA